MVVNDGAGALSGVGWWLVMMVVVIAYHTYCLEPKLRTVPKGDWYCPR